MLYADDIVLIADNETKLQCLLNITNAWCLKWRLLINEEKSQIIHFRPKGARRSDFLFNFGTFRLKFVEKYKYLGIILNEYLNYSVITKALSESAGRALGALINKFKKTKNLGYGTYTTLFDACVSPINDYCVGIWGGNCTQSNDVVQNRAIRFFLGVNKYASNLAVHGDMGWEFTSVRRKTEMLRMWNRFISFSDDRLTKRIFQWDYLLCSHNWCTELKTIFDEVGLSHIFQNQQPVVLSICRRILHDIECNRWLQECAFKPKLRTYVHMKNCYEVEPYINLDLSRPIRSYVAQLRTGTLQLRIETGRYQGLQLEERICVVCGSGEVESECHFLFHCILYVNLREDLNSKVILNDPDYLEADVPKKLKILMKKKNVKHTGFYIKNAFELRNSRIYV